jgi:transcriptional regulator
MDERLAQVLKLRKQGTRIGKALKETGLEHYTYYRLCHEAGIPRRKNNVKKGKTYTMEVVAKVKARIAKGEFLKDICPTMGLDSRNLARFCRINGEKLFDEETLKLNYSKRTHVPRHKNSKRIKIIELLNKGNLDNQAIAKKLNTSQAYVSIIKRKLKKSHSS